LSGKRDCVADGIAAFNSDTLRVGDKYVAGDSMRGFATLMATGEVFGPVSPGNRNWRPYVTGTVWRDLVKSAGKGSLSGADLTRIATKHGGRTGRLPEGDLAAFQRAIWAGLFRDPVVQDAAQRLVNNGSVAIVRQRLSQG
jgi:hypothetical protein